jgi:hypothetical protein
MIQTTRKCKHCKDLIILEEYKFILYKDSYFHYDCLIKSLVDKKKGGISEEEAKVLADGIKEESKNITKDIIARNHLFSWVQKKYDLVVMPSYIYTKFDAIFKGEYKGMTRPIPPEDLLDIWERKWNDLSGLYNWNANKGKTMDATGRINYDIAVILAKSTSYYAWKDTQKTNSEAIKEIQNSKRIDHQAIITKSSSKEKIEDYIIEEDEDIDE